MQDQDQYSLLCQQIVSEAKNQSVKIKKNSIECDCMKMLKSDVVKH